MYTVGVDYGKEAAPKHSETSHVGGVVVGGDYQGLGIVRSLGRHGIPVCVVDDEPSASRFSRYCMEFVRVPDLRKEASAVASLLETADRLNLRGWVLYPTRDELVAAFSRNKAKLEKVFRVPTADWESVQWAWDKRNTYRLAAELDIPIPLTRYISQVEDLSELDAYEPPFVLKPAIKENFVYATKAKAWRADSHAELKALFEKAATLVGPGEIMIQEVIPGGGSQQFAFCSFFREGESVGKMTVRRRRQHPLQFGRSSTYVETVSLPILEELSERFLRAIGYYGLVELEYKLDPRDSRYKLLDVNARTWGYHSLGSAAGVDFSYLQYADQLNLVVAPCAAQPGVAWVRMATDIPTAAVSILSGEIDLKSYFRSLSNCKTEAVFSYEDPLPWVAELLLVPRLAVTRGF